MYKSPCKNIDLLVLLGFIISVTACSHMTHTTSVIAAGASGRIQEKAYIFDVEVPNQPKSLLMGVFYSAPNWENRPVILFVPGGGNPSFMGRQKGNGAETYSSPLNVTQMWAEELAAAGFSSFAYNKRTCRAGQNKLCRNNAVNDIYKKGPLALTADVDAACHLLQADLGIPSERIILWTHGQGGQVVLDSTCGKRAKLVMITAPLTDRIDHMLVRTLHHRASRLREEASRAQGVKKKSLNEKAEHYSNRAESFKATFLSIESDRFIDTASLLGVPLTFWYGWQKSTEDIDIRLARHSGKIILIKGLLDSNYSDQDMRMLRNFAKLNKVQLVQIAKADHYLIHRTKISKDAKDAVRSILIQAWKD